MVSKKKILITGCNGFIASHLIEYFEKKNFFVIATHYKKIKKNSKNVVYKYCDVRNRSEISSILKNLDQMKYIIWLQKVYHHFHLDFR